MALRIKQPQLSHLHADTYESIVCPFGMRCTQWWPQLLQVVSWE